LSIGPRRTATVANRQQTDMWPELDLLERTFAHNGVAQLEFSRGCTNYCSFCPRGHKGQWAGAAPDALPWLLKDMGAVFDRYPHISRTLYLVDEEFIGRGRDAVTRALAVAETLHQAGFTWETSCRVDQAVRLITTGTGTSSAATFGAAWSTAGFAAACSGSSPGSPRSWTGSTRKPPPPKTPSLSAPSPRSGYRPASPTSPSTSS
ncbi:MAG: hypothetical protein ACRDQ9_11615, partial [Pseudonocardiaceae bacterium]